MTKTVKSTSNPGEAVEGVPLFTSYVSSGIPLPADFLASPLPLAPPISSADPSPDAAEATALTPPSYRLVEWSETPLARVNAGRYAAVLDGVLSPDECRVLLRLAEASVPAAKGGEAEAAEGGAAVAGDGGALRERPEAWKPALVNIGGGMEILQSDYRNSDRIIWDRQEVVDRLWRRCLEVARVGGALEAHRNQEAERQKAEEEKAATEAKNAKKSGWWDKAKEAKRKWADTDAEEKKRDGFGWEGKSLETFLAEVNGDQAIIGRYRSANEQCWKFVQLNERMRFLRYGVGGFFRPHCDGPYETVTPTGAHRRTLFTLHLYLCDAACEVPGADLVGGATSFLGYEDDEKVDVDCKMGRVLIFQHERLYHSGDDVLKGTKYTMRTDLLYELVESEKEEVAKKGKK